MGSCFSTEENRSTKREQTNLKERQRHATSYGREDTRPIYITGKGDNNGLDQATSYTDKAMLEQDMFRQIVSRTARNLIDISSQLTPVMDEERAALLKLYSAKTASFKCEAGPLFNLPAASASNSPAVVRAPNPIKTNQQFIAQAGAQLSHAWAETKEVRDFGRVVIPFEEFSAQ